MQYLLSIKTVFPKPGARVWYDDQRVHRRVVGFGSGLRLTGFSAKKNAFLRGRRVHSCRQHELEERLELGFGLPDVLPSELVRELVCWLQRKLSSSSRQRHSTWGQALR